jgi:transposase-like protein
MQRRSAAWVNKPGGERGIGRSGGTAKPAVGKAMRGREGGKSCVKSVYTALAVNVEVEKEVLGFWAAGNGGAKFWMGVLTELKNHGLKGIPVACADGLSGFPGAVRAVHPDTRAQLCAARMARNSARFVPHKGLKKACADLKQIYSASTEEGGCAALEEFGRKWNGKYPMIRQPWERRRGGLSEFFKCPPEIRRAFSAGGAILKMLYLAIRNASEKQTVPIRDWGQALNQFAIEFGKERVPFL